MDTVVPNNPYVGPRSIKTGEAFFGRDREIRSLSALLIAERIVLLHSPSGAGKSSLIQAGLVPRMAERFSVLPLVRVNLEAPEEVRGVAGLNRYVLSTLLSLEEGLPPEKRLPLAELATLSLDAYLEKRAQPDEAPENCLLLFDQFEEVLTVSPTDGPAKQQFFEQLGEALQNRRRWALFAIREDYMGGLAPYTRAIPNRLNVPFRLGLLGPEAAKTAIQQPAKNKEVDFTDEAAGKLVDDLRRIQVQQPDGSFVTEAGPNVEPVQLQVVCFNLWQSHAADDKIIDENDLQRVGSVDQALASFYANSVKSVSQSAQVDERILRQWFDEYLITPEGIRSQVLKGAETSEGLPNIVLRLLENTHLVRGETRAGKTWYELSHDRLVQPVRQDNTGWFEHNLTILQRQAVLWSQQGRSEGLLLRQKALAEAEKEVSGIQLTPEEQAFLEACRVLRKRERQDIGQKRMILGGLITSLIFLALSVTGFFRASQQTQSALTAEARANQNADAAQTSQANAISEANVRATAQANAENQRQIAEEQVRAARAGELSLQANAVREKEADLAMLLGIEAFRLKDNSRTRAALLENIQYNPQLQRYLFGHSSDVTSVAISPNGKIIASASYKIIPVTNFYPPPTLGEIILWDTETGKPTGQPLIGHYSAVTSIAFSPDGNLLASSTDEWSIILWDLNTRKPIGQPLESKMPIHVIAFDPTGKLLASGNEGGFSAGNITLWDVQTGKPLDITFTGEHTAEDIAFSPDGKTIASADWGSTVTLWDAQTGKPIGKPFIADSKGYSVSSVAFSPDGKILASSSYKEINTWDPKTRQKMGMMLAGASDIAFTPDGKTLVSANGEISLWDATTYQPMGQPWAAGTSRCIAISADGKILVSGNEDGSVTLWNTQTTFPIGKSVTGDLENISNVNVVSPDGKTLALAQQDSKAILLWDIAEQHMVGKLLPGYYVYTMALSPNGKLLATNGSDSSTIVFWNLESGQTFGQLLANTGYTTSMAFSPDGKYLATTSHSIRLWDVETRELFKEIYPIQNAGIGERERTTRSFLALESTRLPGYLAISEPVLILLQQYWNALGPIIATPDILYNTVGMPPAGGYSPVNRDIIFSPDGKLIAYVDDKSPMNKKEGIVKIWDFQTDTITELPDNFGYVSRITFSPDGKILVTAGEQIAFWNTRSWKPDGLGIKGNSNIFSNPTLNQDGTVLAVTNGDSIMLWEARSRLPIGQPIPGFKGSAETKLLFNPADNGKSIISTGCAQDCTHGAVILWDLDPQSWIEKACERVGRNFTYTEWEQLFPETDYRRTCENWPIHPTVAREIIEQTFSDSAITQKAKTALDKVAELLQKDTTVEAPISGSKQLVSNFVQEKLMQMPVPGTITISDETLKSMIALVNDANYLELSVEPSSLNQICWNGSIAGYAQDVLHFCEQAVNLAPDDTGYQDSRGLARALTGDFAGAILDFQSYVDERIKNGYGKSDLVKQRQQWIADLKAGKNPFTPDVLEMLKGQW